MTYRWEVSGGARRSLHRLPEKVGTAVVEFVTGPLLEGPLRMSKPLQGDLEGLRSARRGQYRVLFRLVEPDVVLLIRVDHRVDAYRPR